MKLFFDTEFMEDGRTIELLSIGIVREDGAEFYAEADWVDYNRANPWVRDNVLPHLQGGEALMNRTDMRTGVLRFAQANPEFWTWYGSYDWVVLCQLFGRMVDLPSTWPMYVNDLKQHVEHVDRRMILPRQATAMQHHALADARWLRAAYDMVELRRAVIANG